MGTFLVPAQKCTEIHALGLGALSNQPRLHFQNPPKYEYGYNIADEKGSGQGKLEARDGEYALGR